MSTTTTAQQVEDFLKAALSQMQAELPEYAILRVEVRRHLHTDGPADFEIGWRGYYAGYESFPKDENSSFQSCMDCAKAVVSRSTPQAQAARLREQARLMLEQAASLEGSRP